MLFFSNNGVILHGILHFSQRDSKYLANATGFSRKSTKFHYGGSSAEFCTFSISALSRNFVNVAYSNCLFLLLVFIFICIRSHHYGVPNSNFANVGFRNWLFYVPFLVFFVVLFCTIFPLPVFCAILLPATLVVFLPFISGQRPRHKTKTPRMGSHSCHHTSVCTSSFLPLLSPSPIKSLRLLDKWMDAEQTDER